MSLQYIIWKYTLYQYAMKAIKVLILIIKREETTYIQK